MFYCYHWQKYGCPYLNLVGNLVQTFILEEDLKKAEYLLFVLKQIFGKQNADKLESQNKTENLRKENKSLTDINIKLLSKIQRIENTMILKGIM